MSFWPPNSGWICCTVMSPYYLGSFRVYKVLPDCSKMPRESFDKHRIKKPWPYVFADKHLNLTRLRQRVWNYTPWIDCWACRWRTCNQGPNTCEPDQCLCCRQSLLQLFPLVSADLKAFPNHYIYKSPISCNFIWSSLARWSAILMYCLVCTIVGSK